MATEKIHIEQFLELGKHHPVIDVRSPGEYTHAHIPGAYNLPLFTDEERKIVGTTYKQQSREEAIKTGLEFFGPKMRSMVERSESLVNSRASQNTELQSPNSKLILLYCWRGGMRSAAVAWLLDLYGFNVYTLEGGYKKFRNHVLETFSIPFQFKIIGGYTGSGKTELLHTLKQNGEKVIDLEGMAKHKGSAFGNIGMPKQPTQEMFENILATELRAKMADDHDPMAAINPDNGHPKTANLFWLEDESQRIGLVNIPNDLWKTMRQSPVYFLNIPFEERLNNIVAEYGHLDIQKMTDAIIRIKEKLGDLNAKTAIRLLHEENTKESFRILLKYYDKYYLKALHNREEVNSLLHTIECSTVTPENTKPLVAFFKNRYQTA